jgi:hypothetical protein
LLLTVSEAQGQRALDNVVVAIELTALF